MAPKTRAKASVGDKRTPPTAVPDAAEQPPETRVRQTAVVAADELPADELPATGADLTVATQNAIAAAVQKAIRPLAARMDRLEKQLAEVAADRDHLLGLLKETGRAVHRTEVAQRSHNVIVHGVEESTGISPEAAMARAASQVGLTERGWTAVKRVGRVRQGPAAKPRPLQLRMESEAAKHRVFGSSSRFRQRGVHLDDDLTPAQQASRREQLATFRSLKELGYKPYWRLDRLLFYRGGRVCQHQQGQPLPPPAVPATQQPAQQPRQPAATRASAPAAPPVSSGQRAAPAWQARPAAELAQMAAAAAAASEAALAARQPAPAAPSTAAAPPAGTTATGRPLPGPPQPLPAQQAAQSAPAEPPQVASA